MKKYFLMSTIADKLNKRYDSTYDTILRCCCRCSVTQSCPTSVTTCLQHARLPCSSPSPRVCSNSCPLNLWCQPAISSSSAPSPRALNLSQHQSFPMSRLFTSGDQSIGASASVLPVNIQDWFSLELTGLISLLSKRLSRVSWTVISWLFSTV